MRNYSWRGIKCEAGRKYLISKCLLPEALSPKGNLEITSLPLPYTKETGMGFAQIVRI